MQFGKVLKQIRSHAVMRQIENNINIIIYYIITFKKIIIISKMNVNYFNYFIIKILILFRVFVIKYIIASKHVQQQPLL